MLWNTSQECEGKRVKNVRILPIPFLLSFSNKIDVRMLKLFFLDNRLCLLVFSLLVYYYEYVIIFVVSFYIAPLHPYLLFRLQL